MSDRNARFAVALVDALARLGVRHACITPGSRNTPLSVALADSAIHDWSHHDERSSAFFALGIAKSTGAPVVIVTTSGTAAAELHPALAEAKEGRVALIAVTADRPPELRGIGAPQTIDQRRLFGPSVKWALDLEVPDHQDRVGDLAARLWSEAMSPPRGPVHLNLAMRDPLVWVDPILAPPVTIAAPDHSAPPLDAAAVAEVARLLDGRRGVVVAGPDDTPGAGAAAAGFAAVAGWPILADPLSGVRAGDHDLSHVLAASDPLAWGGFLERSQPEAVVRFGAVPTSKPIWQWLGAHRQVPQVFIEPAGMRDPTSSASMILRSDPTATLRLLGATVSVAADPSWLGWWRRADAAAAAAVAATIEAAPFPNEPLIARTVAAAMVDGSDLWVASSMPVRDLDAVMAPTRNDVRVLANRGANGIDGFVSSALGSAAASGRPTAALAGDLSVLHDVGALATASRLALPLTLIVVNNDGGGIFHMLPHIDLPHFERHWGTPHGLGFSAVAAGFGVPSPRVASVAELAAVVGVSTDHPQVVELVTDRAENAALHGRIRAAVAAALAEVPPA